MPTPSRSPASAGLHITIEDPSWHRLVPGACRIVRRAAGIAGGGAIIVLASDATVKQLNARHRGRNKPTNVLTFEPAFATLPGEIIIASGVVAREAVREGKRAATVYLEPEALKQLQFLALDEGVSLQSLLIEGVNAVFEKRGKSRLA